MAKKKRNPSVPLARSGGALTPDIANNSAVSSPNEPSLQGSASLKKSLFPMPSELGRGDWTAIIVALMLFFTPALGVPNELMLQDTLKSIIVAFMTLGAALVLFWSQRNRSEAMRWHLVMWLPIMLCAYALGSMAWSHTYLAGVEAIRWFIFAIIVWLVLNCANRERFAMLAWGVHLGALAVALLGAAQFWFDTKLIPQGPIPAASFVNRNFAAEFMACTYVFSAYLLLNTKRTAVMAFLSITSAFHIVYLMMCGTRSALVGSAAAFVLIAVMAWRFRAKFVFTQWDSGQRIVVVGLFFATIAGLGFIKSGNPGPEFAGVSPIQRALFRTSQIKAGDSTLVVRQVMWKATQRMIEKRPLTGVGAGAWEVDIPLYQEEGSQLETDYYAHNEVLQLLGEYGAVGWLFMLILIAYCLAAAWRTFRLKGDEQNLEGPIRSVALISLLALMIVSNIGFPWRLAATGMMFALCLGLLGASDARLGFRGLLSATRLPWRPAASQGAAVATLACLALAAYISQQAAECEQKIVTAVKMALSISQSGNPNSPKNDKTKAEMMRLAREGVAINPHYRKITPMLGDELAKWGDWKNATWVWESVVGSRPYVVAMMSNVARGKAQEGDIPGALAYLERSKKIQPKAVSVRSLEVILLSRSNREAEALKLSKVAFADKTLDIDMMNAAHILAIRASDFDFAVQAMQVRNQSYPAQSVDGLLKIGAIQYNYQKDEAKAVQTYREAYAAGQKSPAILAQIPVALQSKL